MARKMLDQNAGGEIDATAGKVSPTVASTLNGTPPPSNPAPKNPVGSSSSSASNASNSDYVIVKGLATNIVQDRDRRGLVWRWFRSMFSNASFSFDKDITQFQIVPITVSNSSPHSLTSSREQVVLYGKIGFGLISDCNKVEVYGKRDKRGYIVPRQIKNLTTGTTVKPTMTLSRAAIWTITLSVIGIIGSILATVGPGFFINLGLLIIFILFLPFIVKCLVFFCFLAVFSDNS